MKSVGGCVLLLASLITPAWCEFVPLEPTSATPRTPIYYVFSLDGSAHTVCAVVSSGARYIDLVLQPTVQLTNGTFLVKGADGSSRFTNENGEVTFSLQHIQRPCVGISSTFVCDQLVVAPNPSAVNSRGEFKLQYIPQFTNTPVNLTFEYSPPAIFFDGNSTFVDLFGNNDSLTFKLRQISSSSQLRPSVCEILENGTEATSTAFDSSTPREDDSCIAPSGLGLPITAVQIVGLRSQGNVMLRPGPRRLFLTEGSCENNTLNSPLRSEPLNVTIVLGSVTTTPPIMESTFGTAPTQPPVESDFPVSIIIIIPVIIAVILIVVVVLVLFGVCIWKKRTKANQSPNTDMLEMNKMAIDQEEDEKALGELSGKDEKSRQARQSNNYVPVDIAHLVTADSSIKALPSTTTASVSGLIFITDGETECYKDLEEKLLTQHGCDRLQPVAAAPDHTPGWDEQWCWIASQLKNKNCLVYVIWSGSLETTNGNHNPPIRKVIQSLERSLRKNTPDRESVNHRLVLLQLGSKGTADYLITDLYTKVFWDIPVDDPSFDAKKCSCHVCEIVCKVLTEHIEHEQQVKNNESRKSLQAQSKSFVDGPSKKQTSNTPDDQPVTGRQWEKTVQSILGKLDESKEAILNRVDRVGQQVELVDGKVDQQNMLPAEEFQDES